MIQPPEVGIFDEPLGCLQINEEWYSFVSGLLHRAEKDYFWDDDEQDGKDAIAELINSFDTVDCPGGTAVHNEFASIGYVVDVNETGSAISADTWTQVPFNNVLAQDGLIPQIQDGGSVILPAGIYMMRSWCAYYRTGAAAYVLTLRVTDGVAVDQTSGHHNIYGSGKALMDFLVYSDGSTPIQLRLWASASGYFGNARNIGLPAILAFAEFRDYKET